MTNLRWDTSSANNYDMVRDGTHAMILRDCCPYDHLLVEPNLVACLDYRSCLACRRAYCRQWKARQRGRAFDFRAESDLTYRKIMGEGRP